MNGGDIAAAAVATVASTNTLQVIAHKIEFFFWKKKTEKTSIYSFTILQAVVLFVVFIQKINSNFC